MLAKLARNRLKDIRESIGFTQEEVAERMHPRVSVATVSRHENGTRTPSPADLRQYAQIYNVEIVELFVENKDNK